MIGTDNTARKEAEEALSRAGALQTAIFNSANFSSIATDAQGVIQIFNVGAARMLGYTAADVVNKITPADISDPQEVIARAKALSVELDSSITPGFEALVFKASRGIEDIYELTYIRKDGSRFPAVVSVTALRDDQEAIIGYLLIGTDNTARKQADDKLRAAGQYARSLIEASLDPLVTISPDGKITDVNEGSVMVTGVSREKLIGTDFSDYFTEPETAREGYREAFSKGSVTDYPLTIRHQDGRLTDVLYNASVYKDAAGKVLGVFAAARDITARKQVEEEQKKLGQRLRDHQFYTRSLFESNIDALMTTDPEGIITDVNKQMEALSGCTRDELIGAPFKNNFTDPERAEAGIKLVLLKKKVTNYELTVSARDGNETVVSYNATTLYDRNRKLQGVFAAARDITEHKLAQAQILNLALHDPLTQLPNRRLLNELLGRTLAASQRNGRYAALMFLDLDNFKSLNDTQGHHIGDLLLVEVSRRIIHCVRGIDVVARLGGDEFVVILKELDTDLNKSIEEANIVAEKIRAALEEPYLLTFAEAGKVEATVEHRCTSSIGVVVFINHDQGQDGILKWADTAMYEAKKAGRNMIMFYDPAWK
ncbi:PAS domain S-box protein [Accumulibacter sp.]|uniref:sensor domain-containing protein n=1 Tax=Accumulibacter sp. TaxID=2053492 RepID=UPI00391BAF01